MSENNTEYQSLLVRFWDGTITAGEYRRLEALLRESPARMEEFRQLNRLWMSVRPSGGEGRFDADRALLLVRSGLRRRTLLRWWMSAAAVLVLGLASVTYFSFSRGGHPARTAAPAVTAENGLTGKVFFDAGNDEKMELRKDVILATRAIDSSYFKGVGHKDGKTAPAAVWRRIYTTAGAEYSLLLADGTRVWLNAGSELRYPVDFIGTERRVFLKGEAYFEVKREEGRPFRVGVYDKTVEVFGTDFNVNAYEEDALMKVSLVSGSVGIRDCASGEVGFRLRPSEEFCLDRRTGTCQVGQFNAARVLAWRNGLFVFDRDRLETITAVFSRWYGVKFTIDPRLSSFRYSGTISRDEKLENVLDILSSTEEIRFRIRSGHVVEIIPTN